MHWKERPASHSPCPTSCLLQGWRGNFLLMGKLGCLLRNRGTKTQVAQVWKGISEWTSPAYLKQSTQAYEEGSFFLSNTAELYILSFSLNLDEVLSPSFSLGGSSDDFLWFCTQWQKLNCMYSLNTSQSWVMCVSILQLCDRINDSRLILKYSED